MSTSAHTPPCAAGGDGEVPAGEREVVAGVIAETELVAELVLGSGPDTEWTEANTVLTQQLACYLRPQKMQLVSEIVLPGGSLSKQIHVFQMIPPLLLVKVKWSQGIK